MKVIRKKRILILKNPKVIKRNWYKRKYKYILHPKLDIRNINNSFRKYQIESLKKIYIVIRKDGS